MPSRIMALAFFVLLFLLPLLTRDLYVLHVVTFTCLFAIFSMSWDLLSGIAGQLSFGHSAFFGVAGYTSALINIHFGWPVAVTIPLGVLGGVAAGLVIGLPSLKLRGAYFTITSLAFPIILTAILFSFPDLTGGEFGLTGFSALTHSPITTYYLLASALMISALILWKLGTDSKIGIVLSAIAQDEIAAKASGINTTAYKLSAFCISGFFAGIAGAFYVHVMKVCGPTTLGLMMSFDPVIRTMFGGAGTIYGGLVGTFVLYPLMEALHVVPMIRMLIYAIIIIVVMFFMPEGIAKRIRDLIEIECPRCKKRNWAGRALCHICSAQLRLERGSRAGAT
jgi:branched-chain amino acid transport system permease protein